MSSYAVPEAVKNWIANEASGSSFRESVGDRYYHVSAPDNSAWPLAVYTVTQAAEPMNLFGGGAMEVWRVGFAIWVHPDTGSDQDALDIDAKLFLRFDGATLAIDSPYQRMVCRCVSRGAVTIDGDGFRCDSEYELRGGRTT